MSPLLFIIIMEYLHTILHKLKHVLDFNYHSKCENLHIINLSFTYDLLLFARGDPTSVNLLMQAYNDFSSSTGLVVNPAKCKVYYGRVEQMAKEEIQAITYFKEGSFPIIYLSIPFTNKKLSSQNCMMLVEKITNRIKHWSSRLLSYAGILQLIRSVLFSISNYRLQFFPLSKRIFQNIEAICRSFLWTGKSEVTRKSPIAWNKVCAPEKQGDLNLISLQ